MYDGKVYICVVFNTMINGAVTNTAFPLIHAAFVSQQTLNKTNLTWDTQLGNLFTNNNTGLMSETGRI